jgi:hypothetical protein
VLGSASGDAVWRAATFYFFRVLIPNGR